MKKKTKIIIMTTLIISAIIISIIPSYAYAPTYINVTFIDEERENETFTYNIYNEWGNIGYIIFDYDLTGYITIIVAPSSNDLDQATTIYKTWLPMHYYANIEAYASGDDTIIGYLGDNGTDVEYSLEGALSPDSSHQNIAINIEYVPTETIVDYTQYLNYGEQRYAAGMYKVLSEPNKYALKTLTEYNNYGTTRYNQGYNDGVNSVTPTGAKYTQAQYDQYGVYNHDIGYEEGLNDGYTASRTMVSIFNVGVTGVANVFNSIVNGMGIFGTTIASVLATGIIIIMIFLIFKAIRS